jgi:alkylation response protein AidB-like acyl-CoA dehydrogenase
VAQKITGNAIEWCGGNGFVRDTGIEKYWRDSKVSYFSMLGIQALKLMS